MPFDYISFMFVSIDSLSKFDAPVLLKIGSNFIYCHFLFAHVSDVIDCFQHLSNHYVNFK